MKLQVQVRPAESSQEETDRPQPTSPISFYLKTTGLETFADISKTAEKRLLEHYAESCHPDHHLTKLQDLNGVDLLPTDTVADIFDDTPKNEWIIVALRGRRTITPKRTDGQLFRATQRRTEEQSETPEPAAKRQRLDNGKRVSGMRTFSSQITNDRSLPSGGEVKRDAEGYVIPKLPGKRAVEPLRPAFHSPASDATPSKRRTKPLERIQIPKARSDSSTGSATVEQPTVAGPSRIRRNTVVRTAEDHSSLLTPESDHTLIDGVPTSAQPQRPLSAQSSLDFSQRDVSEMQHPTDMAIEDPIEDDEAGEFPRYKGRLAGSTVSNDAKDSHNALKSSGNRSGGNLSNTKLFSDGLSRSQSAPRSGNTATKKDINGRGSSHFHSDTTLEPPRSSQKTPTSSHRAPVVSAELWTPQEDRRLLHGYSKGLNTKQVLRSFGLNRTESAARSRRIFLENRMSSGDNMSNKQASSQPDEEASFNEIEIDSSELKVPRPRWSEQETSKLRHGIAAGLFPLEIQEKYFPDRSQESVIKKVKKEEDSVLEIERTCPTWPADRSKILGWDGRCSLLLRRAFTEELSAEVARNRWFSFFSVEVVASKLKDYRRQMARLTVREPESDDLPYAIHSSNPSAVINRTKASRPQPAAEEISIHGSTIADEDDEFMAPDSTPMEFYRSQSRSAIQSSPPESSRTKRSMLSAAVSEHQASIGSQSKTDAPTKQTKLMFAALEKYTGKGKKPLRPQRESTAELDKRYPRENASKSAPSQSNEAVGRNMPSEVNAEPSKASTIEPESADDFDAMVIEETQLSESNEVPNPVNQGDESKGQSHIVQSSVKEPTPPGPAKKRRGTAVIDNYESSKSRTPPPGELFFTMGAAGKVHEIVAKSNSETIGAIRLCPTQESSTYDISSQTPKALRSSRTKTTEETDDSLDGIESGLKLDDNNEQSTPKNVESGKDKRKSRARPTKAKKSENLSVDFHSSDAGPGDQLSQELESYTAHESRSQSANSAEVASGEPSISETVPVASTVENPQQDNTLLVEDSLPIAKLQKPVEISEEDEPAFQTQDPTTSRSQREAKLLQLEVPTRTPSRRSSNDERSDAASQSSASKPMSTGKLPTRLSRASRAATVLKINAAARTAQALATQSKNTSSLTHRIAPTEPNEDDTTNYGVPKTNDEFWIAAKRMAKKPEDIESTYEGLKRMPKDFLLVMSGGAEEAKRNRRVELRKRRDIAVANNEAPAPRATRRIQLLGPDDEEADEEIERSDDEDNEGLSAHSSGCDDESSDGSEVEEADDVDLERHFSEVEEDDEKPEIADSVPMLSNGTPTHDMHEASSDEDEVAIYDESRNFVGRRPHRHNPSSPMVHPTPRQKTQRRSQPSPPPILQPSLQPSVESISQATPRPGLQPSLQPIVGLIEPQASTQRSVKSGPQHTSQLSPKPSLQPSPRQSPQQSPEQSLQPSLEPSPELVTKPSQVSSLRSTPQADLQDSNNETTQASPPRDVNPVIEPSSQQLPDDLSLQDEILSLVPDETDDWDDEEDTVQYYRRQNARPDRNPMLTDSMIPPWDSSGQIPVSIEPELTQTSVEVVPAKTESFATQSSGLDVPVVESQTPIPLLPKKAEKKAKQKRRKSQVDDLEQSSNPAKKAKVTETQLSWNAQPNQGVMAPPPPPQQATEPHRMISNSSGQSFGSNDSYRSSRKNRKKLRTSIIAAERRESGSGIMSDSLHSDVAVEDSIDASMAPDKTASRKNRRKKAAAARRQSQGDAQCETNSTEQGSVQNTLKESIESVQPSAETQERHSSIISSGKPKPAKLIEKRIPPRKHMSRKVTPIGETQSTEDGVRSVSPVKISPEKPKPVMNGLRGMLGIKRSIPKAQAASMGHERGPKKASKVLLHETDEEQDSDVE